MIEKSVTFGIKFSFFYFFQYFYFSCYVITGADHDTKNATLNMKTAFVATKI